MSKYICFFGNPGSGKTTLLNCEMKRQIPDLQQSDLFKSGVSVGYGLTSQLSSKVINEVTFFDTPGLEDLNVSRRKASADAITLALRQNGIYQIVFVVTLESGRIRPADLATISLVLEASPDIKVWGIIFNKVTILRQSENKIQDEIVSIVKQKYATYKFHVLFIDEILKLKDKDNEVAVIPGMAEFMQKVPFINIDAKNVANVPHLSFRERVEILERSLQNFNNKVTTIERVSICFTSLDNFGMMIIVVFFIITTIAIWLCIYHYLFKFI